VYLQRFTRRNT